MQFKYYTLNIKKIVISDLKILIKIKIKKMCGQIGFSGYKGQEFDINKIKLLLFFNQERGKDATGIWTPLSGITKTIQTAEDFISTKSIDSIIEDNTLMGHCRQGTVGKAEVKNAHPFNYGNIVFQHNGTLTNHNLLARKYKIESSEWDVDSQVIAHILNKEKNPNVFTELEGAFACVFTDTSRNKGSSKDSSLLYVIRNDQRPLYHGKDSSGMYISSIEKSLKAIGCEDIQEFSTEILYTIIDGEIKKETQIELKKASSNIKQWDSRTGTYNQSTSILQQNKMSNYVGRWIQSDTKRAGSNKHGSYDIVYGEWYFCKSILDYDSNNISSSIMQVIDTKGKIHYCSKSLFYFCTARKYDFKLGDEVVFMSDVVSKDDAEKVLFKKGDIRSCDGIVNNNEAFLITDKLDANKQKWECKINWIRPLQDSEILFKENIFENTEAYKEELLKNSKVILLPNLIKGNESTSIIPSNPSFNSYTTNNNDDINSSFNDAELEEEDMIVNDSNNENGRLDSFLIENPIIEQCLEDGKMTMDDVRKRSLAYHLDPAITLTENHCNIILDCIDQIQDVLDDNMIEISMVDKTTFENAINDIKGQVTDFYTEVCSQV